MSTIKFKRTSGSIGPTGLTFGEPAYVQGLKSLYIGQTAGDPALRIGAEVSTDGTLTSNSDNKIPTEKAVRTYVSSGLTGIVAGTGISVSGQTGNVTITNVGVQSISGTSNEIEVSGTTGAVTIGLPNDVTIGNNLTVTGNLTVNGNTTTVNSNIMTVDDPIFLIGTSGGVPISVSDTGKDRGVAFTYFDSTGKTGFFGYDASTGYFTFVPDATITNEVVSGTVGSIQVGNVFASGATFTGNIYAPNIVNSVNGQTGDVTISAGASGVTGIVAGTGISISGPTGNVTITNTGVLSVNGSNGTITNVARINEGNTFTVRQVMNAGATMTALYVANGITLNGTRFELRSNSNPVIIGQNTSTTNLKLTATNTSALIPLDPFINFVGGDTDASTNSIIYIDSGSIISGLGRVDINTNVLGITANQTLRGTLNVTGLGTFNTGITAAGATFTSSINLLGSLLINGSNGSSNQVLSSTGSGITWATASGGGLSWSAVTADRSLVAEEGVLANKSSGTLTLTLPTTAALGKVIRVSGMQNTWRIAQNASQKIHFGKITTTTGVGGYLENSNAKDAVELVCCVADLEWNVISSIGNITIV